MKTFKIKNFIKITIKVNRELNHLINFPIDFFLSLCKNTSRFIGKSEFIKNLNNINVRKKENGKIKRI